MSVINGTLDIKVVYKGALSYYHFLVRAAYRNSNYDLRLSATSGVCQKNKNIIGDHTTNNGSLRISNTSDR